MALDRRVENNEKAIITEFCHLLEKSKQLFNGLRELPQYGHKQWQSYFGRTFDVYTKLWKFQQLHRTVLDQVYGLKRWQIGEVASKIGQLYYHYYLRTSDTNFLHESLSFYSAIRQRGYYSKANKEEKPDLMVKKLRYYARFIVVCLLLKKMKLVNELVKELSKQVDDYYAIYQPDDHSEWNMVLHEIRSFIEADNLVEVTDSDGYTIVMPTRLSTHNFPPFEKGVTKPIQLCEVFIVGNCYGQIKFSELTLDMFRMLQTLESEAEVQDVGPGYSTVIGSIPNLPSNLPPGENGFSTSPSGKRLNPHKYLLYKPSFAQFNSFLASGFKDLPNNGAMLVYLSADGEKRTPNKHGDDVGYELGGVITNNRTRSESPTAPSNKKTTALYKDTHCIHPGDLFAYTRKPLFLIIDSDNSTSFKSFPNLFNQPVVCLMSPERIPTSLEDHQDKGNLFTLFLHCPLTATIFICGITSVSSAVWEKAQSLINRFLTDVGRIIVKSRNIDPMYTQFYGDDFLRLLLLRFCFCCVVLRLHRGFHGSTFYPSCRPTLPEQEIFDQPGLHKLVHQLAAVLDSQLVFASPDDYSRD